ncbi:CHAT domain-containing protein [Roridomyces roridus]|uniref:CHAT domain-containing protein n=1 Tax=Roridomyces roridus TaxID=1738132 RepID=A0AAD7BC11_9AGAR|nr:CHAT domain-containing protein [Roridomyces roridus]
MRNLFGKRSQKSTNPIGLQSTRFVTENDRVQEAQKIIEELWTRYRTLGNLADLEAAAQKSQQLLEDLPLSHPARPDVHLRLAVCVRDRYIRNGDPRDIQAAVENGQKALETARTNQIKMKALVCLARCYKARYRRLNGSGDIDMAIQNYQEVLEHVTDPSWADPQVEKSQILFELGTCFGDRFEKSRQLQDLEEALKITHSALGLTSPDASNRIEILRGLAWALQKRSERLGNLEDLNKAIQQYEQIIKQLPVGYGDKGRLLYNLATCFGDRFRMLGESKDLDAAASNAAKALSVIPQEHPLQLQVKQGLAWCYRESFRRTGKLEHLQTAVDKFKEVLDQTPVNNNADRALMRWNLAVCLADRYRRLMDLRDLDAVVINAEVALRLMPPEDPRCIPILQRLGWCSQTRFQRLGDLHDLETAIQKYQEVLDKSLPDHPERPRIVFQLASAFKDRFERTGNMEDLNSALENSQIALDLVPSNQRLDRIEMLQGSASHHWTRFKRLGHLQDLETSIQQYQQRLDLTPKDLQAGGQNGLALCLRDRFRMTADFNDLKKAIEIFQEVLRSIPQSHPYEVMAQQGLASCLCDQYEQLRKSKDLKSARDLYMSSFQNVTLTNPETSWEAALEWATFSENHNLDYCLSAYLAAFQLLPDILWIGNTISVRQDALQRLKIGSVTANATRVCLQLSNLMAAVQIIEQGIATVFQQTLQLRPEVNMLPGKVAQEFQRLSEELFKGTSEDLKRVAVQRKALLDQIRSEKSYKHFLVPNSYDVLRSAAKSGPVIILNSQENGCDAIVIKSGTTSHSTQSRPEVVNPGTARGKFADLLQWLWQNVVQPIFSTLASRGIYKGRIWWLPTGAFSGLPFHASSENDQFIHSYTMTLGSLIDSHAKGSANIQANIGLVGVSYTGPGKTNYIGGVVREMDKISSVCRHLPCHSLREEQATPDAVTNLLKDSSWVHLACHGIQDSLEPAKSRLLLYDGNLELETILRMPLSNAEFVFLSACQTVMGDATLVNESFHLGGGFIAAGFRSVVGTLWSMNDQDGPLVAELFYSFLFKNGRQVRADHTAEALHFAVKELRARNVPYERWIPFIHMGV